MDIEYELAGLIAKSIETLTIISGLYSKPHHLN